MRKLYERLKGTYREGDELIVMTMWALFLFICMVEIAKGVGA